MEGNTNGHVISVANGAAALGPVGGMLDFGGVVDSYGSSKLYITFGWAYGFGATAGMGYSQTSKNFNVNDLAGQGAAVMLSILYTSGYRICRQFF